MFRLKPSQLFHGFIISAIEILYPGLSGGIDSGIDFKNDNFINEKLRTGARGN